MRDQAEGIVADYLEKELSIELISNFITEVNDTLIERAIQFALQKVPGAKDVDFCWLSLGSEGREEQLLRTDQDNAILYRDNGPESQAVLLEVGKEVNDLLAQNVLRCAPRKSWLEIPATTYLLLVGRSGSESGSIVPSPRPCSTRPYSLTSVPYMAIRSWPRSCSTI